MAFVHPQFSKRTIDCADVNEGRRHAAVVAAHSKLRTAWLMVCLCWFGLVGQAATTTYLFDYPNRAALLADGWSFIATTAVGGSRDTEQTNGAVISYNQTAHPGALRIPVDVGDLWSSINNTRNSLFRNLSSNWVSLRLQMSFAPVLGLQQAHLTLYQNDDNYVSAVWAYNEGSNGRIAALINENGGQASPWSPREYKVNGPMATNIHLRLDRDLATDFVTVLISTNGTSWTPVHTTSQVLPNPKIAIWAGGSTSGFPNCDLIRLDVITSDTPLLPMLSVRPTHFVFNAVHGEPLTNAQLAHVILRRGHDERNWSVSDNASWISTSVASGTTPGICDISVNTTGLNVGRYNGKVTFSGSGLVSNQVDVTLIVNPNNRVRQARWANGFSGALSVSTDDSYDSGSSQLFTNGMRGTFYLWGLTAAPPWTLGFQNAGMELGTHTISHPCFIINEPALRYELEASIALVANGAGIPQGAVISHCWPCGFTHTRGRAIAADYFLSARGYNINQFEDVTPHDYMNLKSFNSHEHNPFPPDDFKVLVDQATTNRQWFNLVLHAFNNDDGAIAYAAGKDLEIKPVGTIVKYLTQRARTIVTNYSESATQIGFDAYRLPMPTALFRNFETNLMPSDQMTFEVDVTGIPSIGALTVESVATPYMVRDVGAKRMLYFSTTLTTNLGNRTVQLTLSNATPVAISQWVNAAEDASTNIVVAGTTRPGNGVSYTLLNAPTNGALNGTLPNVTYTPDGNFQGGDAFRFRVTDTTSNLRATGTVSIAVAPRNDAPTLGVQSNRTINAFETLVVTNAASDIDQPGDVLSYSLLGAPLGAQISSAGVISWTPNGTFANTTNLITTRVVDNGVPPLSATNTFLVIVLSGNHPPVLPTQTNREFAELSFVAITNAAADADGTNLLTYQLIAPPTGAEINTNGVITWTPTEAQGPGIYQITTVVTDDGQPPLSATNQFQITVLEVNVPPTLAPQANREITEGQLLTVTNSASDPDVPANLLIYQLINPPPGASVSSGGVITWTPGESEGPGTNLIVTVVSDGFASATNAFEVIVLESNEPPVFVAPLTNVGVAELVPFAVTNSATDADLPPNSVTYALLDPPAGMQIDTNGVITWTPSEAQGPSTNQLAAVASDGLASVTNSFTIVVTEVNEPPVMAGLTNQTVRELELLVVTNAATDSDWPPNQLTYQLLSPPAGAEINSEGVITWTPTVTQGGTTNDFTTVVSDGTASATNQFSVTVEDTYFATTTNVMLVATGAVWKYLDTGVDQGTAWRQNVFDDTSWSSGPAQLGYGDGDEQTVVGFGTNSAAKYTTTYFRHAFDLTGRTNFSALQLRVLRDDGVVVYLNGIEVFRDNLPPGEITFATFALSAISNQAEDEFLSSPVNAALLLNGTNVIAAEIHQNQANSTDISFDFELTGTELIVAPKLPGQTNQVVAEMTLLMVTNQAFDFDSPAVALNYQLINPPAGASMSPDGVITWTPTEAQGPGNYLFTTVVSDGRLTDANEFEVAVSEINRGPEFLVTPVDQIVAELGTLIVTNQATDPDLPLNNLIYHLIPDPGSVLSTSGPNITAEGVLTWTPTEMQGPSTNRITIVAEDDGAPPLSVTNSFLIVVLEINEAPVLPAGMDRVVDEMELLTVTNSASDIDWPANQLTYQLLDAPAGAAVDADGIITWTPTASQGPSTNTFTMMVADDGIPPLQATNHFAVIVPDTVLLPFAIASLAMVGDQIVITWEATPGRSYRLQYKTELAETNWIDVLGVIHAETTTATATNALEVAEDRFYRVRLLP